MIRLFLGAVGSGKSYHALAEGLHIAGHRDKNRVVVANFPINFPKENFLNRRMLKTQKKDWIYIPDEKLKVEELIKISIEREFIGKEGRSLLIIDEAGLFFNSRDWMIKPKERKEWSFNSS